jgi:hypothetical protein
MILFNFGKPVKGVITRPEFKRFVDGIGNWKWSTDQTLLNYWIKKEKMKVKNLSWQWNALYTAVEDRRIKEAHFIHFFLLYIISTKIKVYLMSPKKIYEHFFMII